ncbi:MAG: hypothetical protein LBR31_09395, partial [Desulfovibrio sp.]|nr:hypothetical protein [Desulfovibrio sp.]
MSRVTAREQALSEITDATGDRETSLALGLYAQQRLRTGIDTDFADTQPRIEPVKTGAVPAGKKSEPTRHA